MHPVAAIGQFALADAVAVRQQERIARLVGHDAGSKARQHVRAILIISNVVEAFGFALRAQRIAGQVQPFQRGVFRRVNVVDDGKSELCRQLFDDQLVILLTIGTPRLTVDLNAHQRQIFAIQHQRAPAAP